MSPVRSGGDENQTDLVDFKGVFFAEKVKSTTKVTEVVGVYMRFGYYKSNYSSC